MTGRLPAARPAPAGLTLAVIAKEPLPGRVKTRLCPPCTPAQAAALARAALHDTLTTLAALPARRRVLALDGRTGPWLPPGFDVVPQARGTLDERLAAVFTACEGPVLLVGMDTPQLDAAALAPALSPHAFAHHEAWLGPARDGGFWALALAAPAALPVPRADLLRGVPMSRPDTGARQLARLRAAGLRTGTLATLTDVDTASDALHVAALAPGSRFAAAVSALPPGLLTPRTTAGNHP